MRVFERGNRINFVDDNNVFVGFDNESYCCEHWGYMVTEKIPTEVDEDLKIAATGYNFDTKFFAEPKNTVDDYSEDNMATFRLVKDDKELFLTLFNCHNGYYGHGFEAKINGIDWKTGLL